VSEEAGRDESALLAKTSSLRDELLVAAGKLEQYVDALKAEVVRLRKLAEDRKSEP
jgi:hypothetical protein